MNWGDFIAGNASGIALVFGLLGYSAWNRKRKARLEIRRLVEDYMRSPGAKEKILELVRKAKAERAAREKAESKSGGPETR